MDKVSKKVRSKVMSSVRSKNTKLEQSLFEMLINVGLSNFSTHVKYLPGKPDIVFTEEKVIVFVDSCFWHGCPKHLRMPASNIDYWQTKLKNNKKRDRVQRKELREQGWKVLRIWEHDLKNTNSIIAKISRSLRET
jgi:DNA mismatch endonuclease (patch repair protein)